MEAISLTIHSLETEKCKIFENVVSDGLSCLENCIRHDMELFTQYKKTHPNVAPDWPEIIQLSNSVIQVLQDIAEHEPILFEKSLHKYVDALAMIIKNNEFPETLRTGSVEILIKLAQADSAMCRKSDKFPAAVIDILFDSLLLEPESDQEWEEYLVCLHLLTS